MLFSVDSMQLDLAGVAAQVGVEKVDTPVGFPAPRYNIAPTQLIPIVRAGTPQELSQGAAELILEPARWGLFPHWKKDDSGPPLFNARAETAAQKPSFRDAMKHSRCLIPMDGYYEWHSEDGHKIPQWIRRPQVMWVAGLWSTGLGQLSTTMITTESRPPLDWVHHRMPRFLPPELWKQWLFGTPEEAAQLLTPADETFLKDVVLSPADPSVGNARNEGAHLLGTDIHEACPAEPGQVAGG